MTMERKTLEIRSQWNFFWWVFGTICSAFTLPYFVYGTWDKFKVFKHRKTLAGKVVLITGATSGLGEALSHVFFKAGCKLILSSRREDELERVRRDLLQLHLTKPTHPPVIIPLDLSDLGTLPGKVQKALEVFGHIDILINNGGVSVRSDILSTSIDVDIKVMLVNYFGGVVLSKEILPSMIKRKCGHIVFISSVQGKFSIPFRSAYSASKHAVQAFCDCLRAEVAQHNINVTCISPGYINTSLSKNALKGDGQKYGQLDKTTAEGMSATGIAEKICAAILCKKDDVIIAEWKARVAYYLRLVFPSIYFWIMGNRAKKLYLTSSHT